MPFRYAPGSDDEHSHAGYCGADAEAEDEHAAIMTDRKQQKSAYRSSRVDVTRNQSKEIYEIPDDDEEEEVENMDDAIDEYYNQLRSNGHPPANGSNGVAGPSSIASQSIPTVIPKEIANIDSEIDSVKKQLRELQSVLANLQAEKRSLQEQYTKQQPKVSTSSSREAALAGIPSTNIKRAENGPRTIDYGDSTQFSWLTKRDDTLKKVFGISKLRLCQEGVLNAVNANRDVICIMPTGGGKSVCFQLPALLSRGTTLVISPLISLMSDQVMHLREKGIEAVMITGSTTKEEIRDIHAALLAHEGTSARTAIKLCYVTPEKIARSKTFQNILSRMREQGLLARIAIDESHCCSQLGHDFRPDYKKLSLLRSLYPGVPIVAFTATCGRAVLNDVVRILQLKECTPGSAALPNKTVFFSAPLYRANLHYSVRPKPASADKVVQEMADQILANHRDQTGIVYTLSQKDTQAVADGLRKASDGAILTGTYHAGMDDYQKQRIHEQWRKGKVKCVVATIAFGLGIDAPNVRYVYHHSMSKSMEGYYQESGRAGRDGNDSECVLWFRAADASRLSTLTMGEVDGAQKLYSMLTYAVEYQKCRKLLFDEYFGNPASVVAPFAESDTIACGHCDNCARVMPMNASTDTSSTAGALTTRDVTMDAWKICVIVREMDRQSGRCTLPQACEIVRGLAKGLFGTVEKGVQGHIDVKTFCGGKVALNKEDTEMLLLKLLMGKYLKEDFYQTAYATISYIISGSNVNRLARLKQEEVESSSLRIELTTLAAPKAARKSRKKKDKVGQLDDEGDEAGNDNNSAAESAGSQSKARPKGKGKAKSGANNKKDDGKKAASRSGKKRKVEEPNEEDMDGHPTYSDADSDLPEIGSTKYDYDNDNEEQGTSDGELWHVPSWRKAMRGPSEPINIDDDDDEE